MARRSWDALQPPPTVAAPAGALPESRSGGTARPHSDVFWSETTLPLASRTIVSLVLLFRSLSLPGSSCERVTSRMVVAPPCALRCVSLTTLLSFFTSPRAVSFTSLRSSSVLVVPSARVSLLRRSSDLDGVARLAAVFALRLLDVVGIPVAFGLGMFVGRSRPPVVGAALHAGGRIGLRLVC